MMIRRKSIRPYCSAALCLKAAFVGLVVCGMLGAPGASLRASWLGSASGESSENRAELEVIDRVAAAIHNYRRSARNSMAPVPTGKRVQIERDVLKSHHCPPSYRQRVLYADCWSSPLRC